MDNPAFGGGDEALGQGESTASTDPGGDGDGEPGGDGDGEPGGDGDGEPGGDGDGDGESGGDGEPGDGDGDGDGPCEPGLSECEGECVDPNWDNEHCSACGQACGAGQVCAEAACVAKKYVFVTSVIGPGSFGGLVEGIEACDLLAALADLPGSYRPWLSEANASPAQFNKLGAYVRTDEVLVAANWEELVGGELRAPINRDETGLLALSSPVCGHERAVWTGTDDFGLPTQSNCNNWQFANDIDAFGSIGDADATVGWSLDPECEALCLLPLAFYCFQQ